MAFVEVVEKAEAKISTVAEKTGLSSDAVLSELRSGLLGLGYVVESGKTRLGRERNAAHQRQVMSGSLRHVSGSSRPALVTRFIR